MSGATARDAAAGLLLVALLCAPCCRSVRSGARRARGALTLRCRALLLAGAPLLLPAAPAAGSVVRALSVEQLAARAEVVVQARVVAQRAAVEDGLIVTDHTLQVLRCHKGRDTRRCATTVELRTLGGELGDQGTLVEGSPRLQMGDVVVLFARQTGPRLSPLGLALGVYRVVGRQALRDLSGLRLAGPDGVSRGSARDRLPLEELEARVRAAVAPAGR